MKKFFAVAVWYWAVIALYGYLIRQHTYNPLPFIEKYAYWLHAHSHAAFLGWLHAGFAVLLAYVLFPEFARTQRFKYWFVIMQLLVAGMLISFPLQGYKAVSITLLSLFLVGTYFYARYLFAKNEFASRLPATTAFAKAGVIFMLISSLSPWALGPVMVFLGKKSVWYQLDIYFYLHFQYNGWFFTAMLALMIYLFEHNGVKIPENTWKKALMWLFAGIFWGYITNTLWIDPPLYFNIIALASVLMEGYGLWILFRFLKKHFHRIPLMPMQQKMFKWLTGAIAFKVMLQFAASCPYYAELAYIVRDLVIGYIHFVMLGILSVALLLLAGYLKLFRLSATTFWIYFSGMLAMVGAIWWRGFSVWQKIPVTPTTNLILVITALWTMTGVFLIAWYGSKNVCQD